MSNPFEDNTTAWLSTTASQIFLMQLGFLCFEVGFVSARWTESIILKNIEDTFVGIFTYLVIGYTLSESPNSIAGIISIPEHPLLIGVDESIHDQIFISSLFAATTATIISGAVLHRMKNKVYITYCFLVILINYSFVSHWVWHEDGWLNVLGFTDGSGALVVHSTAGIASFVATWNLGPRKEAIGKDGKLLPIEKASRPIFFAAGTFLLWYGWFAFNIASPIAYNNGLGDAIGTTTLVTAVSPICAAGSSFLWIKLGLIPFTYEDLLSSIVAGLVGITGACHSCNVIEAGIIGFFSALVYFVMCKVVRYKLRIDDPLNVISMHCFCGMFSCFAEGIVANGVYGTYGLIFGDFEHFGVQCLGIIVITIFNLVICLLLYTILDKCIFRNTNVGVTILDTYMGKKLFIENIDTALKELLKCDTNIGRRMLLTFHKYMEDRFAQEQLDFLIVIAILNNVLDSNIENNSQQIAYYILAIMDIYVENDSSKCINVSGTQRAILFKIKRQLLSELEEAKKQESDDEKEQQKDDESQSLKDQKSSASWKRIKYRIGTGLNITEENVFYAANLSVWGIVQPHFTQFLLRSFEPSKTKRRFNVRIPFKLNENWELEWDQQLIKQTSAMALKDTVLVPSSSSLHEVEQNKDVVESSRNLNLQEADSLRQMTLRQIQMTHTCQNTTIRK